MSGLKFTILGSGSSGGVPRIGGHWGACDPAEPKNRRSRCSMLIEQGETRALIDTSPDLREQVLKTGIDWVDGVFYTHAHADQAHGIDDLRVFALNRMKRVQVYGDAETLDTLTARFDYCFEGKAGYPPILLAETVTDQPVTIAGEGGGEITATPFPVDHGTCMALGWRVGGLAYIPDVLNLTDEAMAALQGLDVFVIDALRYKPHPTHAHLEKTLGWISELKPKHAVLTNLHVDLDYQTLKAELPQGVEPAFDGMVIEL